MLSKNTIRFLGGFFVSFMSFFGIFKKTEINTFSPNREMSLPFLSHFMPRHANITGLVVRCFRSIHAVLLVRHFAQIAKSIVRPFPIYMVNFSKRPKPTGHCNSNPVRWNYNSINANLDIAIAKRASVMPSFCPLRCIFPYEVPGIGVVGKFFAQSGYRNFSHSQCIPHFLNGDKYASFIG